MKYFDWNNEKNEQLIRQRNICFEDVLVAMESRYLLDVVQNTNYENQKIFIVKIKGYAYLVPFIEDEEKIFFKTIIPSRKGSLSKPVDHFPHISLMIEKEIDLEIRKDRRQSFRFRRYEEYGSETTL